MEPMTDNITWTADSAVIAHSGTKGMEWYHRRYQNLDGSLTPLGREHYGVGKARHSQSEIDDQIKKASAAREESLTANKAYSDANRKLRNEKEKARDEAISKSEYADDKAFKDHLRYAEDPDGYLKDHGIEIDAVSKTRISELKKEVNSTFDKSLAARIKADEESDKVDKLRKEVIVEDDALRKRVAMDTGDAEVISKYASDMTVQEIDDFLTRRTALTKLSDATKEQQTEKMQKVIDNISQAAQTTLAFYNTINNIKNTGKLFGIGSTKQTDQARKDKTEKNKSGEAQNAQNIFNDAGAKNKKNKKQKDIKPANSSLSDVVKKLNNLETTLESEDSASEIDVESEKKRKKK